MCFGIDSIVGGLIGAGGAGLAAYGKQKQQAEQEKQAQRIADARNRVLLRTNDKNRKLAEQSRGAFDDRMAKVTPGRLGNTQRKETNYRNKRLTRAADTGSADDKVADIPMMGSTHGAIKEDAAKKFLAAAADAKARAQSAGKLGGYGDLFLDMGLRDNQTARDLSMFKNFMGGNIALLPAQQDFAAHRAYRPVSQMGAILEAIGNGVVAGAGSGAFGSAPSFGDLFAGGGYG